MAGELLPVRAEGVRLDQLGAGLDERDMEGRDRVGGPKARLLGAPQTLDRAEEEDAGTAVGDDRLARREAFVEAGRHGGELTSGQ